MNGDVVRRLLEEQHREFSTGPLVRVDEGWDNFTYRVGSSYAVRLPRRKAAVQLTLNEQSWLPVVARWLSVAVPLPVAIGAPSSLFPWPWTVVEWIPGKTCDEEPLEPREAESLATVLRALHRPAPPNAPANPFRGVPLSARQDLVEERLDRLRLRELTPLWREAVAEVPSSAPVWIHGDLHPRNVVVREGALMGIVDWGDLTAGDPATDLACAWMLRDLRAREALLKSYQATHEERSRAVGWAVNFASAMVDSGHPRHTRMGHSIIERLVAAK